MSKVDKNGKSTNRFKKFLKSNKKRLLLIILIIAITGVGIGIWYFTSNHELSAEDIKKSTLKATDKIAQLDGQLGGSPSKDIGNKTALDLIKLANNDDAEEAKAIYLNKAIELYVNNGQYDLALPIAIQVEQIKPTAISSVRLANIYMNKKDYDKAVHYYQISADRSEKPASDKTNAPYNDYMILKREAEAKR